MAWIKAGSTTLASAGDTLTVSGMTANKFNTVLAHHLETGTSINSDYRVGNSTVDTGTNYSRRVSTDGGTDSTSTSRDIITSVYANINDSAFVVGYFVNIATEEKLFIFFGMGNDATGSSTAPERRELVAKWANTSDQVDICQTLNDQAGSYDTDSNHSVLGSDGTESLNVQDGAIYHDTDTNKEYVLNNNTWTEL